MSDTNELFKHGVTAREREFYLAGVRDGEARGSARIKELEEELESIGAGGVTSQLRLFKTDGTERDKDTHHTGEPDYDHQE